MGFVSFQIWILNFEFKQRQIKNQNLQKEMPIFLHDNEMPLILDSVVCYVVVVVTMRFSH